MVVNSCYFSVVVVVCFPSLGFAGGRLSAMFLLVQLVSLGWVFLLVLSVGLACGYILFKSDFVIEYLACSIDGE